MSLRRKLKNLKGRLIKQAVAIREALHPHPVETRLVQVLGGTTITIGAFRHNNRPMTITLSRGRILRSEKFRRAALTSQGGFANDIKWAIGIKGPEFERDVIASYERDEELRQAGWHVIYLSVKDIWQNPSGVRKTVLQFMA